MFDQSFSFILTIAALVVGFMLFTGHGSFFMKGGNILSTLSIITQNGLGWPQYSQNLPVFSAPH